MVEKLKDKSISAPPKKKGGARPGAGRPKGGMNAKTIEKMKVKEAFETRVAKHADKLFNAQVTVAMGAQYLFKRYKIKKGKKEVWSRFERVTEPDEMAQYLDGDFAEEKDVVYYMITAEKPDVHAIDSLLDRAFGRAPQNLKVTNDGPDPIALLLEGFGLLTGDTNAKQTPGAQGETPT